MTIAHKDEQQDSCVKFFVAQELLSALECEQFLLYRSLLIEWNNYFNLTAIVDPAKIIVEHFQDSLALRGFFNISAIQAIADVGTGAGFPGIPLAIVQKNLSVILIEVNGKKRNFLQKVIDALELKNVFISAFDWRTFIRKTNYPIDLFCARASLRPDELVRQFATDSNYQSKGFVYWASENWNKISVPELDQYLCTEYFYFNGNKNRKLVWVKKDAGVF